PTLRRFPPRARRGGGGGGGGLPRGARPFDARKLSPLGAEALTLRSSAWTGLIWSAARIAAFNLLLKNKWKAAILAALQTATPGVALLLAGPATAQPPADRPAQTGPLTGEDAKPAPDLPNQLPSLPPPPHLRQP